MWSRRSSAFCPPSHRPTVRDDPLRRWPSRTESRSDFNILRSSNGPMVTQRRQTQPWSSRARNDRVSTSPYLRCPAPSNRIATGTRTDSGEERFCHAAYRTYVKAAGYQRVGKDMRRALNRAIAAACKKGLLRRGKELKTTDQMNRGGGRAAPPPVRLRTRGPRGFHDIPPTELLALVGSLKIGRPSLEDDALLSEVL